MRKQESRKLRLAHAAEMQVQASLSELSIVEAPPSAPAAAAGSAIVVATAEPLAAIALTLDELASATGGFAEQKLNGSGGYGRVFTADALPSLPLEKLPPPPPRCRQARQDGCAQP